MSKKTVRGRPPKDNPRDKIAAIAVSAKERKCLVTEATAAGMTLSAFLRLKLGLENDD